MPAETDLDQTLARLRDAAEQIRANLVELDHDRDRELLEHQDGLATAAASPAP